MSSYKGNNLFASGPHRFEIGGVAQRTVERALPGADGVRLSAMGRTGRSITQMGTLIADDIAGLDALTAAIESSLDGESGELIDDLSRRWTDVVMLAFEPEHTRRIGVRLAVDYTIRYSQVRP